MTRAHTLGFPRIGAKRELKFALESYWRGETTQAELVAVGKTLRERHWQAQHGAGVNLLPVGDFAWYDQVLGTSLLVDAVPARHRHGETDLDTLFRVARGRAPTGPAAAAAEMTKWFNTNYHYLVPEFSRDQRFKLGWSQLFDEVEEAKALGLPVKAVLLGPVSYLWLGKEKESGFSRLELLDRLLIVYQEILAKLAAQGVGVGADRRTGANAGLAGRVAAGLPQRLRAPERPLQAAAHHLFRFGGSSARHYHQPQGRWPASGSGGRPRNSWRPWCRICPPSGSSPPG